MLIRLNVDKLRVDMRLWGCGAVGLSWGGCHGGRPMGAIMGADV